MLENVNIDSSQVQNIKNNLEKGIWIKIDYEPNLSRGRKRVEFSIYNTWPIPREGRDYFIHKKIKNLTLTNKLRRGNQKQEPWRDIMTYRLGLVLEFIL